MMTTDQVLAGAGLILVLAAFLLMGVDGLGTATLDVALLPALLAPASAH